MLIARGHRVDAIVSRRGPLAVELRALGAGVARIGLRPEMTAVSADARALAHLARLLAWRRWDVVHTHSSKAGALARPIAAAVGLPVVHSPHGFAHATQHSRARRAPAFRRAVTLGIERLLAPLSQVILCVSEAERDGAIADGVAAAERFAVVPHGIDLAPRSTDPGLRLPVGDAPIVGFLGRMDVLKGPLVLVDALTRLRRDGHRFRAVLVGDGPLAERVHAEVTRCELAEVVSVLPYSGTTALLTRFDLLVAPSLFEAFPIGLLDAMAAGVPIVASRVGGIPEIVEHGRTGLLVRAGDGEALAGPIAQLLADPGLRRRMGDAGRRRCEQHFGLEVMVERTEAVYHRALRGSSS